MKRENLLKIHQAVTFHHLIILLTLGLNPQALLLKTLQICFLTPNLNLQHQMFQKQGFRNLICQWMKRIIDHNQFLWIISKSKKIVTCLKKFSLHLSKKTNRPPLSLTRFESESKKQWREESNHEDTTKKLRSPKRRNTQVEGPKKKF